MFTIERDSFKSYDTFNNQFIFMHIENILLLIYTRKHTQSIKIFYMCTI